VGSAPYLAALLFQKMTGARMAHRAYSDTRMLYEDLAAGRLDLSFNNAASMMSAVKRGQAYALATTAARRSQALADIPTLAESGLAEYELDNWLGFVAPPHTSLPILTAQADAITATLRDSRVSSELSKSGIEVVGGSPSEFADFISNELRRWSWLRAP
jgi:tripartite-type tricarboxylate transporter receptor subunit TctC